MAGFEPAASCSQSRRANQAALHPVCCTGARPTARSEADARKSTGKRRAGWQSTARPPRGWPGRAPRERRAPGRPRGRLAGADGPRGLRPLRCRAQPTISRRQYLSFALQGRPLSDVTFCFGCASGLERCPALVTRWLVGRERVRYPWLPPRGRSSMVEPQPSKLVMRVRFPSPAPLHHVSPPHRPQSRLTLDQERPVRGLWATHGRGSWRPGSSRRTNSSTSQPGPTVRTRRSSAPKLRARVSGPSWSFNSDQVTTPEG
jgi:hypothetical protein